MSSTQIVRSCHWYFYDLFKLYKIKHLPVIYWNQLRHCYKKDNSTFFCKRQHFFQWNIMVDFFVGQNERREWFGRSALPCPRQARQRVRQHTAQGPGSHSNAGNGRIRSSGTCEWNNLIKNRSSIRSNICYL